MQRRASALGADAVVGVDVDYEVLGSDNGMLMGQRLRHGGNAAMKPVVLYASRYGHTQRYAQWLGESLGCPVWNVKGLSPASLASYDTIVLGGSLYAGGMGGLSFLTRHAKAQKWVLFTWRRSRSQLGSHPQKHPK